MSDSLRLEVVTPSRRVLQSQASEIRIPGALGELGVLPGHTPLLTSLGTGEVKFTEGGTTGRLVVQGGFAEVQPDAVTVLATIAETVDEITAFYEGFATADGRIGALWASPARLVPVVGPNVAVL